MTDVVERLRSGVWRDFGLTNLTKEAAAEIERLRAEIAVVVREREDWNGKHQEACIEIERLRTVNRDLSETYLKGQAEVDRLRDALLAAKDYIGNGYQPPDLIKQIDSALKQSR